MFSPKTIKSLSNLPTDFTEPLAVFLQDQVMLLWAKTAEEQTLWRRELKLLIDPQDQAQVDSAAFIQENMQNMSYSYQLLQQLRSKRLLVENTPRQTNLESLEPAVSVTARHRQEAAQSIDTEWLINFFLIFSNSTVEKSS